MVFQLYNRFRPEKWLVELAVFTKLFFVFMVLWFLDFIFLYNIKINLLIFSNFSG